MPKQSGTEQISTQTTAFETHRTAHTSLQLGRSERRQAAHFEFTLEPSHVSRRPCFELAIGSKRVDPVKDRPSFQYLLQHRPLALLSRLPRPAVLFAAGALSGAIGKTITAPLDRVKLLLQTSGGLQQGAVRHAVRKGGVWKALVAIGRTEGIKGYWKGNLPQVKTNSLKSYNEPFVE